MCMLVCLCVCVCVCVCVCAHALYTSNGHERGRSREDKTVTGTHPTQGISGIPEVKVVPGKETSGEIRFPDHRSN